MGPYAPAPYNLLQFDSQLYIITVMSDLTPRQSQVLQLIRQALVETGMPPTRAEIAAQLGFRSPNAAEEHLRALARKGCVELVPGSSRGIRLKDTLREQLGLPLIGRVAAGRPILAEEHIVDHLKVDPGAVPAAAALPAQGRGHEHEGCGHPRWRPGGRAPHRRGAQPPDHRRPAGKRGDRQTLSPAGVRWSG